MKKLLLFATSIAALFFAASCQQENLEPEMSATSVTYTVEVPQVETKAIGDGVNVNQLIYEVWRTESTNDTELVKTNKTERLYVAEAARETDGKFRFTVDLVQDQNYTILFWAQVKGAGYYNTSDLRKVTFSEGTKLVANDEERAAFYGIDHIIGTEPKASETVELTRPFAQINLGSVLRTAEQDKVYKLTADHAFVKVTGAATSFNVATATAGEETTTWAFGKAEDPSEPLTVNNTDYDWVAMNYIFVPKNQANVTVDYMIYTNHGDVTNTVLNVPVQKNYRTNIVGNLLTSKTEYEVILDTDFAEDKPGAEDQTNVIYVNVTSSEDLEKALRQDDENIIVELEAPGTKAGDVVPIEYFVNIGAWTAPYYFGGENTKSITINANGNKINFVHNDSDWNYIRCVSDAAKWVINDAILTNSGKNNGPWNRHDIRFYNAVELNNVKSDKAIALLNDGTLNEVSITEDGGVYGLWITTQGQTVDVDGLSIRAINGGRGIKIADEYVDSPKAPILNVANSAFTTADKAAVLVTSKVGATVNWGENNDIKAVASDPINAVWVDEDRKDSFELVTVNGATKVLEGANDVPVVVTNTEELKAAINAANNQEFTNIYLRPATYAGAFDIDAKKVNLIGENKETTIIDGLVFGLGASHIHLSNITLTNANPVASESARHKADYYCLGAYAAAFVIEDCVFNVSNQGNAAGKGAINIGDGFNAYSANDEYELIVKNTVFNCNGERPIRAKTSTWIEGCTFVDQYRYAIQVQGNNQAETEKVVFTNNTMVDACKTSDQPFVAGLSLSGSQELSNVSFTISGNTEGAKFVFDAPDADITITSCLLNGQAIVEGQCVTVDSETKEVLFDADPEYHYVAATADLTAALKAGASKIMMLPGNYELANPTIAANEVLIEGTDKENCVLKITKQIRAKDGVTVLTLKNLTTQVPTGLSYDEHNFAWIHYLKEFNMINCNSDGRIRLNSHNANIEGCNFTVTTSGGFDGYALHYQGSDKSTVNVKSCTFNTAGKAIVMYNEGKPVFDLNVDDCTFTSSDSSTDKAAIQMHTEWGISGTLDINRCTATGFAEVNGGLWNELNNNTKNPTQKFTVTVDGNTVQQAIPEGYTEVVAGLYKKGVDYLVSSAEGLQKLNEMFADKSAGRDAVLNLTADIDFTGKTWTLVDSHADTAFEIAEINGNGHTISNMTINGQAMFRRFAGSGDVVVKDITFDNATVTSTAINTSILTCQSYQNVLLDNVDVKNSNITGGYKVAPLIATVYNESSSTITATLKNCDVENVTVKATSYDFCTAGMVAFVYADDNDKIEFENCTVKDVKLYAPNDSYKAHAAIYTTGSEVLYNEAEGVTVTNVTFEAL